MTNTIDKIKEHIKELQLLNGQVKKRGLASRIIKEAIIPIKKLRNGELVRTGK